MCKSYKYYSDNRNVLFTVVVIAVIIAILVIKIMFGDFINFEIALLTGALFFTAKYGLYRKYTISIRDGEIVFVRGRRMHEKITFASIQKVVFGGNSVIIISEKGKILKIDKAGLQPDDFIAIKNYLEEIKMNSLGNEIPGECFE